MTTEAQREQQLRREVLRNDLLLRQGSTFQAFAQADAELPGRFGAISKTQIVGANALPIYPAASGPWQGPALVGQEPPLGFDISALEPCGVGEPTDVDAVGSPRTNSALEPSPAQAPASPSAPAPSGSDGEAFSSRPYRRF